MAERRLLLLGDFIRLQYHDAVARLFGQEVLPEDVVVVGPPTSTGTSAELAGSIDDLIAEYRPDGVHFNAGLEDVVVDRAAGGCRVPLADYERNIVRVVEALRPVVGSDIALATTTPVREGAGNGGRSNGDIRAYNIVAGQAMLGLDVLINDLHRVVSQRAEEYLDDDGLHLTEMGTEAAARAVVDSVCAFWF